MNIQQTGWSKFSSDRKLAFVISAFLFVLFLVGVGEGNLLFAASLLAMFFGATNFGRQCPLLLSFRRYIHRRDFDNKQ